MGRTGFAQQQRGIVAARRGFQRRVVRGTTAVARAINAPATGFGGRRKRAAAMWANDGDSIMVHFGDMAVAHRRWHVIRRMS
jgi:hypothetical protein